MKSQRIRKAMETYTKEQRLHRKAGPGKSSKPRKRPSQHLSLGRRKFAAGTYGHGGYGGGAAAAAGQGGQGAYGQSYGSDGGYRGRGGYGIRGAGGYKGVTRPTRTCHRYLG